MPIYSEHLKQFIQKIIDGSAIPEHTMWIFLHKNVSKESILSGEYAEFLPEIHKDIIPVIIRDYQDAFCETRYKFDFKSTDYENRKICPYTGDRISPVHVAQITIDKLEEIWNRFIHQEYDPKKGVPIYMNLMSRLLQMSLHLEWAGYTNFQTFDRKWEQIKTWRRGEYLNPIALYIIKYFMFPPQWFDHFNVFWEQIPVDLEKKVCKDVLSLYTTSLDPSYCGESSQLRLLTTLTERVVNSIRLDDDFKQPFQELLGKITSPTGEKDGD